MGMATTAANRRSYLLQSQSLRKKHHHDSVFLVVPLILFVFLQLSPPFFLSVTAKTTSPEFEVDDGGDSSDIISRFQQYLRIDTVQPNPNYNEAAKFIISLANNLSLESETIEFIQGKPLVLLKWPGKDPSLSSILLNSHTDVVPFEADKWDYPPLGAYLDPSTGNIYARGAQDMKCVGMQYLEAIRKLKASGFQPLRDVYISFVPDEEIGGHDGAEKFVDSEVFEKMNVGIVMDEGVASPDDDYFSFYGERAAWWLVIKANGEPGHGANLYDNSAMENLHKSIQSIWSFRASQFDFVKSGYRAPRELPLLI